MELDINDYNFSFRQVEAFKPPFRPAVWECLIYYAKDRITYGTKFNAGNETPAREVVFEHFKNKETFKTQFFIETNWKEPEDKTEEKVEIKEVKAETTTNQLIPDEIKPDEIKTEEKPLTVIENKSIVEENKILNEKTV
jgi:hypothetical protein